MNQLVYASKLFIAIKLFAYWFAQAMYAFVGDSSY